MSAAHKSAVGPATYDGVSVTLHWITVALVLIQFGFSKTWGLFAAPMRREMIMLHMGFGILLGLAVIARIVWRLIPGHRLPPAHSGASKAVHYLLYAFILFEFVLGFVLRWSGGEAMIFFGLPIPPVGVPHVSRATNDSIGVIHSLVGWVIIILATGHALSGVYHHFVVKDRVLARMIPALRSSREGG
ncbi:MAG: cytochrome [Caulobacteraceae bacterium]|nr:cytochrome [Caulobacteraceae bacterium]